MSYTIGIKLSTTDSDGKEFTSGPTFVKESSLDDMVKTYNRVMASLIVLEDVGAITGYSLVLKCETAQAAPGAGP